MSGKKHFYRVHIALRNLEPLFLTSAGLTTNIPRRAGRFDTMGEAADIVAIWLRTYGHAHRGVVVAYEWTWVKEIITYEEPDGPPPTVADQLAALEGGDA
jgi:hypothetical protein